MGKVHLLYWTIHLTCLPALIQGEMISLFQTSKYTTLVRLSKTKGSQCFAQKNFRKSTPKENGLPAIMDHSSLGSFGDWVMSGDSRWYPQRLFCFLQNETRSAMSPTINICTINEWYSIKADQKSRAKVFMSATKTQQISMRNYFTLSQSLHLNWEQGRREHLSSEFTSPARSGTLSPAF